MLFLGLGEFARDGKMGIRVLIGIEGMVEDNEDSCLSRLKSLIMNIEREMHPVEMEMSLVVIAMVPFG